MRVVLAADHATEANHVRNQLAVGCCRHSCWRWVVRHVPVIAILAALLLASRCVLAQTTPSPALKAIEQRNAERARLGVLMSDNTRGGVLITRVLPDSPAARIGLRSGDRILAINGNRVSSYLEVVKLISSYKPNAQIQLRVDRNGWTNNLTASLGTAGSIFTDNAPQTVAPTPAAASTTIRPGSLIAPPYLQDLTPADIDDQHGYGG
jgi:membrane-associated protease RseP (regulator of RpoE activity)